MASDKKIKQLVKKYWEKPETVSIIDKNLHKIEIDIVLSHLSRGDTLADIGCGDGTATIEYARKVRQCIAFERSNHLRKIAARTTQAAGLKNVIVRPGDVLSMKNVKEKFDAVVTQRLLINMISWEDQQKALMNIFHILKPGGRLIMVENTNDSFMAMNDMRHAVGLHPVPQHWHNRFFDYEQLMAFMDGKFQHLRTHDLGLYYFLTRVYVPMFASFVGFGANAVKDPIFERSDTAARILFEKFGSEIKIGKNRVFGPIQVLVFRREG